MNRRITERFSRAVSLTILVFAAPHAFAKDVPAWAQEVNEAWYSAFEAGDAKALAKLYTEDAIVVGPDQTLKGRKAIEDYRSNEFRSTKFACTWEIDGAHALEKEAAVWGRDSCVETPKSGGSGQKVDSRWLTIYARQSDGSWLTVRESYDSTEQ